MQLFHSDLPLSTAFGYSVLGMLIVFAVLAVLMLLVQLMAKLQSGRDDAAAPDAQTAAVPSAAPAAAEPVPAPPAPGTAGTLKLYNVSERDAAMIMAIVADSLGKPLNELRFISIREVTES